jgi:guanylate kinase
VARLVAADPSLWLSRSWTTRPPRPGEDPDAYTFVDRETFERHIATGGFLEYAEFLGNLYGTPVPPERPGPDVVLEIDVQGAAQIHERDPGALMILLEAPSSGEQRARLEGRGDPPDQVARRLAKATEEVDAARGLGATRVVNDDLDATVAEIRALIDHAREARPA